MATLDAMGEMERPSHDPTRMRVSDADREKVAEVLRRAAGEGRLDLDELDERLEATYAAKTYADLVPITVDLPAHGAPAVPVHRPVGPPVPMATHAVSWVLMGECKRVGAWRVPERHTAFSLMGSVVLDLRQATLSAHETTIVATAIMGEVRVVVDARTHVVVDGTPIMGEFSQAGDKVPPAFDDASPVVRVTGVALMGSVTVQRQPAPGTPKKFLGTY